MPVGAVLVSDDLVLEAKNEKEARPDPTAHAEMLLIREASRRLGVMAFVGSDAVRHQGAVRDVRRGDYRRPARRVVYAARDPKGGADGSAFDVLQSGKTNHRLEVTAGVHGRRGRRAAPPFLPTKARSPGPQEGIDA